MNASDIMTTGVISVQPDSTVQHLAQVLTEGGISGAPVVDGDGRLVGIVSEADVIAKHGRTVADLMQPAVVTIHPDTSVREACCVMTRNQVNRLPVVRDGAIVGIITRSDVVRAIASGSFGMDGTEDAPRTDLPA